MRSLKWSKSHTTFVPEIDHEHQEILQAAGGLKQVLADAAPLPTIQESLHRLIVCIEEHFAHEEKLMRTDRYESLGWHKRQHDTARKFLWDYAPLVEQGDAAAGGEMLDILASWLYDHTRLTDRMMGAFLRNRARARNN